MLAGLAYSQTEHGEDEGVKFIDPAGWVQKNLFSWSSIWDIPLVKPRFGCTFDTRLSLRGYDLGAVMRKWIAAFKLGAKCDLGFKQIDLSDMKVKADWEFGPEGAVQRMPDIREFRISVMYRPFSGDANMFNMSIATVIEHFPAAFEVVIVVTESDVALFEGIVNPHRASATFPLRVLGEPELMNSDVQKVYSKVRHAHPSLKVVTSSLISRPWRSL